MPKNKKAAATLRNTRTKNNTPDTTKATPPSAAPSVSKNKNNRNVDSEKKRPALTKISTPYQEF